MFYQSEDADADGDIERFGGGGQRRLEVLSSGGFVELELLIFEFRIWIDPRKSKLLLRVARVASHGRKYGV